LTIIRNAAQDADRDDLDAVEHLKDAGDGDEARGEGGDAGVRCVDPREGHRHEQHDQRAGRHEPHAGRKARCRGAARLRDVAASHRVPHEHGGGRGDAERHHERQ